jgi:protoporphyrinogen oxidase
MVRQPELGVGARGVETGALFLCDMVVTGNSGQPAATGTDHVVVFGAGATGLTAAAELGRLGMAVTVVEKERRSLGGRSRTLEFMGCRFDIGPQPLCSENEEVAAFFTGLAGDDLGELAGRARVLYRGRYLEPPVGRWESLMSLGPAEAVRGLLSLAQARLNPIEEPRSLEDWARNQLGARHFSRFNECYIEKVWGIAPAELSADGGAEWLEPMLSAPGSFRYPRLGIGQLWQSLAASLERSGHRVRMGEQVVAVRHAGGRVIAATLGDSSGRTVDVVGSHFLSTIPIGDLISSLSPAAPGMVRRAAAALSYRDLVTVNVVLDRSETFPDQWVDVFDPSVSVARITNFKNFSGAMVADPGLTGLGMEYFCSRTDELWSASDAELLDLGRRELVALGICSADDVKAGMVCRQSEALPLQGNSSQECLDVIFEWMEGALPNLHLAGTQGWWGQAQQEASISEGLMSARGIASHPAGPEPAARPARADTGGREGVDILVGFRSGVAQR